jgi:hypothetical protein
VSCSAELDELNGLIERPDAVNGSLSVDDIRVLPLLRSAAVVKSLPFPERVPRLFRGDDGARRLPAFAGSVSFAQAWRTCRLRQCYSWSHAPE